ncbi:MAG: hypothetical protein Q4G47_03620, partial [Lachnospiraceae bacterium]|nr:hypothetical protein [Lachnospiraceae bacterium]
VQYVSESFARTFSRHGSCDYYDGDFGRVNDEGRIKQVRFRITVGKSNGSIKGSSPLAPDLPVRVEFTLAASASGGKDTCAGLYDIRTADMWDGTAVYAWNGTAQSMIGVTGTEVTGMEPFDGCGSLVPGSVTASGGVYSFSIMPEGNVYPGDTFSGGDILLFSRQVQSDPDSTSLQYTVRIESETLYAVSALDDTRSERAFSQYYTEDGVTLCPFYDIANTVDPGGNWHAHIYLGLEGSTTPLSGSGMYQTAGRTAYGKPFTVTVKEMLDVGDAAQSEKSRKLFVLWDNNKVELDVREGALAMVNSWDGLSGGLPSDPQTGLLNGVSGSKTRFVFLTKHDGSCWADEAEMDSAALMSYDDLYMWQTYDDACGYGEICGLLIENYGYAFDVPSENNLLSFTFGMRMKQDKGIIGTSVKFEYAIYSFLENVNTSMGGYSGIGDLPEDTPYKVWNGKLPRTYRKTEWDEQKRIISSSLSENNHPHLGTTLYVEDYAMKIASKILEGGIGSRGYESLTRDLSEANDLVYRITPAFQMISGVREADCTVVLPAPDDAEGNHVAEFKELRTIGADGTPVVLETEGREYQLSDFVPGAEGTLTVSRDDAGEYLSGISYTGDPVTGKKVVLRPAYDPSLALTYAPSGPVLSA